MVITVTNTTETVSGREYPLTITRQVGPQEIEVAGKLIPVTSVTIFDGPLGRSRCYTRAQPELSPGERAMRIRTVKETATQAMVDLGIW